MDTNHQMNYYDYGKNLDAQGVMRVIGGGVNPEPVTHEYVDLGLPSGTLWATENIKDENGNDLYFAWGETSGYTAEQVGNEEVKRAFTWENYKFGPETALTKYNSTDGKTVLDPEDDAATVNWGSNWRMPTKEEFEELTANTEYEWTVIDGVQGGKFTSKVDGYTDKFLFFPALGKANYSGLALVGKFGNFCSVSLSVGKVSGVWFLTFGGSGGSVHKDWRCYGRSVRPVRI